MDRWSIERWLESSAKTELDASDDFEHCGDMARYQQYCPVARATEILGERWSLLIVRNLMFGATTFSSIAQGIPTMSRSMLTKRLRDLANAGIISATPKPNGQGSTYALTAAGADLAGVVDGLGRWAETWVEVLPEHHDPGFALWAWCQVQLNRARLPAQRTVVSFDFADQPAGNRFFWLLIDQGEAELCVTDPGGEVAVSVVADSGVFVDWHRGALSWAQALKRGGITVAGDQALAKAFPTWNTRSPVLA